MRNVARPPTTSEFVDKKGYLRRVWLQLWGELQRTVIQTPWANRGAFAAGNYPEGSLLVITDHPLIFVSRLALWKYKAGHFRSNLAGKPSLTAADDELLYEVTDYDHILRWSGTAWGWGAGNPSPSGIYGLFETAPTTSGWQICDGSTIARLNADATTTNVTVPNVSTPRYLKGGTSAAAVAAAAGTVANTTATNQAATVDAHAVKEVDTIAGGTGDFVFDNSGDAAHASHNHTQDAHNHGPGTLELAQKQGILYYRR